MNDSVYDISLKQQHETTKGMQPHYFKDYVVSISNHDLVENTENFDEFPMHLYISNLSDPANSIN